MELRKGRKRKNKIKDVQLHISINKEDKEEAQRILEECGTTINSVIEMLIKYIINHKGIPFSVKLPNEIKTDNTEIAEMIREVHRESLWENENDSLGKELPFIEKSSPETGTDKEIHFFNLFEEEGHDKDDISESGSEEFEETAMESKKMEEDMSESINLIKSFLSQIN